MCSLRKANIIWSCINISLFLLASNFMLTVDSVCFCYRASLLLRGCNIKTWIKDLNAGIKTTKLLGKNICHIELGSVSQLRHYWHFGLDNFFVIGGGDCPVHCRIFGSISGLYPQVAGSILLVVAIKNVPDITKCLLIKQTLVRTRNAWTVKEKVISWT